MEEAIPLHKEVRQEKRAQRLTFLVRRPPGGEGVCPPEGVGVEKFAPSLESLSSLAFEERNLGCPGNFAGMSRIPGGVPKVCAKRVRGHFSFTNKIWEIMLRLDGPGLAVLC